MNGFDLLLEKELAVKSFDYPEDDGTIASRSTGSERILNFGVEPYHGEEGKTDLLHAIDLNTLTSEDIATLTNPKYLEFAWESDNPRERRDRLENIINKDLGGARGHKLIYGSGPEEMRKEKRMDQEGDGYLTDHERPVKTSSYKTFDASKVNDREYIIFDLDRFKNVLGQMHESDEDYTFENLSDDYLRNASEADESVPIRPNDILYGEPEDHVEPDFIDEVPIEPQEVDKAKATEKPEVEVDSEFEPDDLDTGKVDTKLEPPPPPVIAREKPDIEVKPELGPEKKPAKPKKIELAPDIGKAIDQRVKTEVEKEVEKIEPEPEEIETAIDREIESAEEPEIEVEETDIEESINRALGGAGLI